MNDAIASRTSGPPKLGIFLLAGLTLAWGINMPINKIALLEIDPWAHRAYLCMVGGAGLFVLCRLRGEPWRFPWPDWRMLCLTAFLNVTMWHVPQAFGLLLMKAGQVAVLAFTMPLWTVAFSFFFLKEALGARRVVALSFGVAGLAAMLAQSVTTDDIQPLGVGFILLSAVCWAAGTVLIKGYRWSISALGLASWQLLVGGLPPALIGVWQGGLDVSAASPTALSALTFTILFGVMFGYYAWYRSLELFPASIAAIGTLLIPVIGMIGGWVILGEPMSPLDGGALVLITVAVALVMFEPGRG